jgi:hypothetical protein
MVTECNGLLVVGLGGTLRSNLSTERALHNQISYEAGELAGATVTNQLDLLASQVLAFVRSAAG